MQSTSEPRPRVSLLLLAYNQARLVRQSVAACLAQRCEPLEIVLSDDASTDDTFAQLQAAAAGYTGAHRVIVRRNERNLGIAEHYNELLRASSGELLVTAAADDLSLPDRVARLVQAWEATGRRADLISSHVVDLDEQGGLHDVIRVDDLSAWRNVHDWAQRRPYIIGAGHAFTRRMMARFGPLHHGLAYEDQIMVFRAIASGGAITVDAALVHYRRGGASGRTLFESVAHMRAWEQRRRDRESVEAEQLVRDAITAGCASVVRAALQDSTHRRDYLNRLSQATTAKARHLAFREAGTLSLGWRLKKLLRAALPVLAWRLTRAAATVRRWRR